MDFSANNTALWSPMIQMGIIAGLILLANVLRGKVRFIRNSLMPTAVLAGFILLILRSVGFINISTSFLEQLTYHALALGFIALTLRVPEAPAQNSTAVGAKSGALIVSTYLVQAITGLSISLILAYTICPNLFKASGILLPMAYGQGPGQANNVGTTYEALGFVGGRSFGLSLAAAGYLCACVVGVIYLNILHRRKKILRVCDKEQVSGSVTVDTFQHSDEMPISESVDKLSVQAALIALVYLMTYLLTWGIVSLLEATAPGLAKMVGNLLWGFNFIVGSLIAILCRSLMKGLRKAKLMRRQYQNNYLLSRLSGLAFDLMTVAGIASIDISDLSGNLLPFLAMAIIGGTATFVYLFVLSKKLYKGYEYEGFFSMFGMLTGTLSSGVLLLRELDPDLKTPASNNLIVGSSFGIAFGIPVLLLVNFAAQNTLTVFLTVGFAAIYLAGLLIFILAKGKNKAK